MYSTLNENCCSISAHLVRRAFCVLPPVIHVSGAWSVWRTNSVPSRNLDNFCSPQTIARASRSMTAYRVSRGNSFLLWNRQGLRFPSLICSSTHPRPLPLASVWTKNKAPISGTIKAGSELISSWILQSEAWHSSPHVTFSGWPFFVSSCIGDNKSAIFGINLE